MRAGQCRHRGVAECVALDLADQRRRRLLQGRGHRPRRGRAGGAAGRRAGRRPRSRRHHGLRPDAAAAQLEGSKGFTKDLCAKPASRPPPIAASPTRRRQGLRRARRRADRGQGRRAGRRQGRHRRARPSPRRMAAVDAVLRAALRRGRRRGRHRGIPRGEEASFFALCRRRDVLPLATAQDHKRVGDGDTGPEHRRHGRLFAGADR